MVCISIRSERPHPSDASILITGILAAEGASGSRAIAHSFVWGAQPGWIRLADITRLEAVKEAEFLRNMARCRRFGHEFVVYGRFLGTLEVGGDSPRMVCEDAFGSFGGTYRIDLPSVLASSWLSEDGRLGVVFANMSGDARKVEIELPLQRAGIDADSRPVIETFGPEGLESSGEIASSTWRLTVSGRSAQIVKVRAME